VYKFLVIAPNSAKNSLGRSISLALVAREVGETTLVAYGCGATWAPSAQFDIPLTIVNDRAASDPAVLAWLSQPGLPVIWVSKGGDRVARILEQIANLSEDPVILFDLDDDDAGLAELHRERSLWNRLTLNTWREGHPARVRRAQEQINRLAHGFTFATQVLRDSSPRTSAPSLVLPHVRGATPVERIPSPTGRIRVGFLGTIRAHKGGHLVAPLLKDNSDFEIVCFEDCGLRVPGALHNQVREFSPTTPLREIYSQIDVALIPVDPEPAASGMQLPAKLIDALMFGVPVVSSDTPAIREGRGENPIVISPRASVAEIAEMIRMAVTHDVSEETARALRSFAPATFGAPVAELLDAILSSRKPDGLCNGVSE
jgi:hypothetical protein